MQLKAGVITHYYNKIGVAVVKVIKALQTGDTIKISGHDKEFNQTVGSMQIEHKELKTAKAKSEIGMKVDQPVHEKDVIYKIS